MYSEYSVADRLLSLIGWIIWGSLAVIIGISLISGSLEIPYLNSVALSIIGWSILVLTVIGLILALVTRMRNSL